MHHPILLHRLLPNPIVTCRSFDLFSRSVLKSSFLHQNIVRQMSETFYLSRNMHMLCFLLSHREKLQHATLVGYLRTVLGTCHSHKPYLLKKVLEYLSRFHTPHSSEGVSSEDIRIGQFQGISEFGVSSLFLIFRKLRHR